MATREQLIAQISQELLEELTENGTRDLTEVRLSQMEREVYEMADRVSQRLLRGMLEDQAGQADPACCPCCRSALEERPPEQTSLQLRRCEVPWKQPVKRCPKCRRDFFPSGEDDGLLRGSDL